jgi:hypothetical protein
MSEPLKRAIEEAITDCVAKSKGGFYVSAGTIESTHMHLLLPYTGRDIHNTLKWVADQTTKRVHANTSYKDPVWCKGRWCEFIFDELHWEYSRIH